MDSANTSISTTSPAPPSAPSTPVRDTTRDQRLQVQTLHDVGFTYTQIREKLGLTLRQIQYAVQHRLTPKKRSGRPGLLTQEEIDTLVT